MSLRYSWVAVLSLLFCWTLVYAQELEVIKVDTALINVNVSVTDAKRRPITNLNVENFHVIDQGKSVTIEFFDRHGPASIIFAIDASASMFGEKWEMLKNGLERFFHRAHEGNDYSFIFFNDYAHLAAESVNSSEARRVIKKTSTKGNTALYDALLVALEMTDRLPRRQKAVVLLSDGLDTASQAILEDVQREALARRTTIYAIGIIPRRRYGLSPEDVAGEKILSQLARATGGVSAFPTPANLSKALEEIQADLNSQYTLSYYAFDKSPGRHTVRIRVFSALQPLKLRYQQQYLIKYLQHGEIEVLKIHAR